MKIFKTLMLAAMAAVAAGEQLRPQNQEHRKLEDLEDAELLCLVCIACDVGDATLCDPLLIADFGCAICDILFPGDGGDDEDEGLIGGAACFSEQATVQKAGGSTVSMKELQVGDRILTSSGQYETVYAFGHYNPTKETQFLQIYSQNAPNPLEVTADHLIYLGGQTKNDPVPADQLKVGHILQTGRITEIETVKRQGIYAPLTTGGTLLVDGVAASSYVRVAVSAKHNNNKPGFLMSDHDLVHLALAPYRMVCMGISSRICDANVLSNEDGMPYYASFGMELLKWFYECQNIVVQSIGLALIVSVVGIFRLFEVLLGASLAPLVLFVGALVFTSYRQNKNQQSKFKTVYCN